MRTLARPHHPTAWRRAVLAATMLLAGAAHGAAPAPPQTLQPGLWQISSKVSSADAETDATMALLLQQVGNLPAAQRQQLESLAAQNGVSMPSVAPDGAIAAQACITAEMAARQQIPTGQPGACSSNNVPVPGGLQLALTCSQPASSGKGELRFLGSQAFSMHLDVTSSARGKAEQVRVESQGKWLGARCPATP